MSMWDERFGEPGYAYGTQPNDFLVAHAPRIPKGRVLSLAEGQGRNAVHLARLGHDVLAVDLSPVGLEKAHLLAQNNGVSLKTQVADLASFEIEPGHWQGIVSIFAHLPPPIRKALHQKVVEGLAPGGVFILEAYTIHQLDLPGVGGPGRDQQSLLMSLEALKEELAGLTLVIGQEVERDIQEGQYHSGWSGTVQIVGIK